MANELDFDERTARRYLASLESEYEGLGATLKIVRAAVGAKKLLTQMDNSKKKLEDELDKYNGLVELARKDAEEMEKESLDRISKAEARVQKKELEIGAAIAALEDKRVLIESDCNKKCSEYETKIREKEDEAKERIKDAQERESEAVRNKEIAETKLREVVALAGGGK